jgi:hypothetical protein
MALQTTRIDDLTGEPDATSVVITVNGEGVEIDLAAKSISALTKALAPYFDAGTASKYGVERKGFSKRRIDRPPSDVDPKLVRAWADANGIDVGRQGRVPKAIVDQYLRS